MLLIRVSEGMLSLGVRVSLVGLKSYKSLCASMLLGNWKVFFFYCVFMCMHIFPYVQMHLHMCVHTCEDQRSTSNVISLVTVHLVFYLPVLPPPPPLFLSLLRQHLTMYLWLD